MDENMFKKHFSSDEFATTKELENFLEGLTKGQSAINILANAVKNAEVYLDESWKDDGDNHELNHGDFTVFSLRYLIITAMERLLDAEGLTGLSAHGIRILEGNTDEEEEVN